MLFVLSLISTASALRVAQPDIGGWVHVGDAPHDASVDILVQVKRQVSFCRLRS